jgi:hypothetical protein
VQSLICRTIRRSISPSCSSHRKVEEHTTSLNGFLETLKTQFGDKNFKSSDVAKHVNLPANNQMFNWCAAEKQLAALTRFLFPKAQPRTMMSPETVAHRLKSYANERVVGQTLILRSEFDNHAKNLRFWIEGVPDRADGDAA